MTFDQFNTTLSMTEPPAGVSELLKALWYEKNGNWEAAHNIAQSKEGTRAYDGLHAYLHRVEGDEWNAGYWYRRAGSEVFKGSLDDEWRKLVESLL